MLEGAAPGGMCKRSELGFVARVLIGTTSCAGGTFVGSSFGSSTAGGAVLLDFFFFFLGFAAATNAGLWAKPMRSFPDSTPMAAAHFTAVWLFGPKSSASVVDCVVFLCRSSWMEEAVVDLVLVAILLLNQWELLLIICLVVIMLKIHKIIIQVAVRLRVDFRLVELVHRVHKKCKGVICLVERHNKVQTMAVGLE